ncbi:MAG TPA: CHAT domain-containing protein [Longimicrobium sp.]|nr:CHAT domain-containing protein [Longimicrobium sp.]
MSKLKVLFLATDPYAADGTPLRIPEDVRQIRERVLRVARARVEFDFCLAAQPGDLIQGLRDDRPDVVHFSCHGEADGLHLTAADGWGAHRVPAAALADLVKTYPGDIRLVVLNACHSYAQAKELAGIVGCAIGTRIAIPDDAAITFGASFYRAVARGLSVRAAFETARAEVGVHHPGVEIGHELVVRRDVDAASLVLVPRGMGRWGRSMARTGAAAAALAGVLLGADVIRPSPPQPPLPVVCESGATPPPRKLATSAEPAPAGGRRAAPADDLEAAVSLCRAGNYDAALPLFERAARAGEPEAMAYAGILLMGGHGARADTQRAIDWIEKARDRRNARGMNALGEARERGDGVPRSLHLAQHWYRAAAEEKGFAPAMRNLGRLYRAEGRYEEALHWFRKAAGGGSADAMADVGRLYEEGRVGPPDGVRALAWYREPARRGLAHGMYSVGRAYQDGIGVGRDLVQAREWYEKAARAGSPDAMNSMGLLYLQGWGVRKSRRRAIYWFRLGERAGSALAAANLDALD